MHVTYYLREHVSSDKGESAAFLYLNLAHLNLRHKFLMTIISLGVARRLRHLNLGRIITNQDSKFYWLIHPNLTRKGISGENLIFIRTSLELASFKGRNICFRGLRKSQLQSL